MWLVRLSLCLVKSTDKFIISKTCDVLQWHASFETLYLSGHVLLLPVAGNIVLQVFFLEDVSYLAV